MDRKCFGNPDSKWTAVPVFNSSVCEVDYKMHVRCKKETQDGIKSVEEV